jgi:hypothetical protein
MKQYTIPVSKAVLKMLKRDYGYKNHMRIDTMILGKAVNSSRNWKSYIEKTDFNQIRIKVICKHASYAKLYTIAHLMEHEFKTKMLLYIESAVDNGMEAATAIRNFMDKYDVPLEEYEMDTAYKQWQRYKAKEKHRNLLPLW